MGRAVSSTLNVKCTLINIWKCPTYQHKNVTYWVSSHESNKKFGPFQKKWMLGHCSVVSWRPCRSFLGPKLAQKSDFFTLHLYDPPFQSSIIIIVFYLTVLHGIALLASARKTPIYFTIYYYTTWNKAVKYWQGFFFFLAESTWEYFHKRCHILPSYNLDTQ